VRRIGITVRTPAEREVGELEKSGFASDHATKADNLRVLRHVWLATQELPSTVVVVMRDTKNWLSIEDMSTGDCGDILRVSKRPAISRKAVVV
jgi:hypothetical protein